MLGLCDANRAPQLGLNSKAGATWVCRFECMRDLGALDPEGHCALKFDPQESSTLTFKATGVAVKLKGVHSTFRVTGIAVKLEGGAL